MSPLTPISVLYEATSILTEGDTKDGYKLEIKNMPPELKEMFQKFIDNLINDNELTKKSGLDNTHKAADTNSSSPFTTPTLTRD